MIYINGVAYTQNTFNGTEQTYEEFVVDRDENARQEILATGQYTPIDDESDNQVPQSVIDAALAEYQANVVAPAEAMKASCITKLVGLGLTQEEAESLTS